MNGNSTRAKNSEIKTRNEGLKPGNSLQLTKGSIVWTYIPVHKPYIPVNGKRETTKWDRVPLSQILRRSKVYQGRLITAEAKGWQFNHTYKHKAINMLTLADQHVLWLSYAKLCFFSPLACLFSFNYFFLSSAFLVLIVSFHCCQSAIALATSYLLQYGFLAWSLATSLHLGLATILDLSSSCIWLFLTPTPGIWF